MVFILQQNLRSDKKVRTELTKIYGINFFLANQICDQLGLNSNLKIGDLSALQIDKMIRIVQHFHITGTELKRLLTQDIQRYISIGIYKGFRFNQGLPVRGQRTHTNAQNTRRKLLF